MVHFQEDGCIYSYGMVRFTYIGISSLVGRRIKHTVLPTILLIQGDQKVSVHLMITIQKVTSNVQSVPHQSPDIYRHADCVLEDRVQYSTVHIPNVFCHGRLQIINCVGIVCTVIARWTETFWLPCTDACKTYHTITVYTSVFLKMNPRVWNM